MPVHNRLEEPYDVVAHDEVAVDADEHTQQWTENNLVEAMHTAKVPSKRYGDCPINSKKPA